MLAAGRAQTQQQRGHMKPDHALEPATFRSIQAAQELTDTLEKNLQDRGMGAANVRPELVEIFSELVNNAAEHCMTPEGAHMFDAVIADSGPGIRATLARNAAITQPDTDAEAIELAIQELASGTGNPTRGIGLWMTVTEMKKQGRKLWIHSCSGLFIMYGAAEHELWEADHRQGTVVRFTIPA